MRTARLIQSGIKTSMMTCMLVEKVWKAERYAREGTRY